MYYPFLDLNVAKEDTIKSDSSSISLTNSLFFCTFVVKAKDLDTNGTNHSCYIDFKKYERKQLQRAVLFTQTQMSTAPSAKMVEKTLKKRALTEEEKKLLEYTKWRSTRVKWRNTGLAILLVSACAVLYACFGDGAAGLAIFGILGVFVGLIMFGSHLKPAPIQVRDTKAKSETKEIIKGAVIGGIVAGEAGAVVGATIAKNKLDNQK